LKKVEKIMPVFQLRTIVDIKSSVHFEGWGTRWVLKVKVIALREPSDSSNVLFSWPCCCYFHFLMRLKTVNNPESTMNNRQQSACA